MGELNANDPRPPYVQIADALRAAITDGDLAPGQRLESGRALAARYGVAQMTVHGALGVLRDEGLLVSWQGRGVFVADPLPGPTASAAELASKLDALCAEVADLRERVATLEASAIRP